MSQSLLQIQNGVVLVSADNKTYQETVDIFKLDYLDCDFIDAVNQIIYNQTLQVHVVDGVPQEITSDPALDAVIGSIDDLMVKQASRQPEPPAGPEQPPVQDHEYADPAVIALGIAVAAQEERLTALEGGAGK